MGIPFLGHSGHALAVFTTLAHLYDSAPPLPEVWHSLASADVIDQRIPVRAAPLPTV